MSESVATKPLRDVILLLALRAQGSPFYSVPSEKLSKNYAMYSESIQGSAKRWALGCVNSPPPHGQREPGGGIHAT